MNLIDRIKRMRQGFPSEKEWEKLNSDEREDRLFLLMDEDSQTFDDEAAYEIFTKAIKAVIETREYPEETVEELSYEQMMDVFDASEKYARNWAFV